MGKLLLLFLAGATCLFSQETVDENANWIIRREETGQSQVMRVLHKLTDRYGPRLTGSPGHEAAAQ